MRRIESRLTPLRPALMLGAAVLALSVAGPARAGGSGGVVGHGGNGSDGSTTNANGAPGGGGGGGIAPGANGTVEEGGGGSSVSTGAGGNGGGGAGGGAPAATTVTTTVGVATAGANGGGAAGIGLGAGGGGAAVLFSGGGGQTLTLSASITGGSGGAASTGGSGGGGGDAVLSTGGGSISVNAAVSGGAGGGAGTGGIGGGGGAGLAITSGGTITVSASVTGGAGGGSSLGGRGGGGGVGLAVTSGGTITVIGGGSFGGGAGGAAPGGMVGAAGKAIQLSGGATTLTINGGTVNGEIGVSAGSLTVVPQGAARTLSSVISGAGSFTKSGTNTLTLSGASTYTGGTTLSAGALSLGSAGAIGSSGTISFGGGTLQYGASNTTDYSARFSTAASQAVKIDTNGQNVTFANALTSSGGSLTKSGAGTLTLLGANTYTGGTTVSAGSLTLGNGGATGSLAGNVALSGGNMVVNRSGALTLSGDISGAGGLSKSGAGALTLSGTNSYGGATHVDAGELVVEGSMSNTSVTLFPGATLTNKGTISSAVASDGDNVTYKLDGGTQSGAVNFGNFANNRLVYSVGFGDVPEGGGFSTGGGSEPDWSKFSGTFTKVKMAGGGDLPAGAVVVESGGNTLVVTPDALMDGGQQVAQMAQSRAGQIVQRRMVDAALGGWTRSFVVNSYAPGDPMVIVVDEPRWWAEGFGSLRERPKDGVKFAASRAVAGGALAGVDMPVEEHGWRWGAWLGGYAGRQTLGETRFREIDSDGALAGGYVARGVGDYIVSAGLQLGYARHDSRRVVGSDIARAEYGGAQIAPSISVMRPVQADGFTLVPSVGLSYAAQWRDGYGERGSSADQSVEAQWGHSVSGRAEVEARLDPIRVEQGALRLAGRVGIGAEHGWSEEAELMVLNTPVALSSEGRTRLGGALGVNAAYRLDQGPELYVDAEAEGGFNGARLADDYGLTARAGIRLGF